MLQRCLRILSLYRSGQRDMYGVRLPEGLRPNEKLPDTIITPTSKAFHGGHDEPLTPADIVSGGLLTEAQWEKVSGYALALFARGREMARERGLILVDTKYEFGVDARGEIVLADEIHTPDSSRYWFLESYQDRFETGEESDDVGFLVEGELFSEVPVSALSHLAQDVIDIQSIPEITSFQGINEMILLHFLKVLPVLKENPVGEPSAYLFR